MYVDRGGEGIVVEDARAGEDREGKECVDKVEEVRGEDKGIAGSGRG